MKRNGGPVQQWVDSIPSPTKSPTVNIQIDCPDSPTAPSALDHSHNDQKKNKNPIMTISKPISVPSSPAITMTSVPRFVITQ